MTISAIRKLFWAPGISREALDAYWDKLPKEIAVQWFRDGDFIIGDIEADGYSFKTQAKSAREFVDMVNDALFSVYKISVEYFPYLKNRKFQPTKEQFQKLNNEAMKKSSFNFKKFNEAYQS